MPKPRKESPAELSKLLAKGARVAVFNTPEGKMTGSIAVPYDKERTGKQVGIRVSNFHPLLHSCDGACDEGYGWWALPEEIHVLKQ